MFNDRVFALASLFINTVKETLAVCPSFIDGVEIFKH